jgi:hypothetical protein
MSRTASPDLMGQRFGKWTVIGKATHQGWSPRCLCRCECGVERAVRTQKLLSGLAKTCGASGCRLSKTHVTHGGWRTKEYRTWHNLKCRCLNPNNKDFPQYGGRGITVCERWVNSFEAFLEDMGHAPTKEHSIDRKNGDGPYSPENCRWATKKEQVLNRKTSVPVEHEGVRYETLACLADARGLKRDSLRYHFQLKGLPLHEALGKAARA